MISCIVCMTFFGDSLMLCICIVYVDMRPIVATFTPFEKRVISVPA